MPDAGRVRLPRALAASLLRGDGRMAAPTLALLRSGHGHLPLAAGRWWSSAGRSSAAWVVLGIALTSACVPATPIPPPPPFTVMTYNIQYGGGVGDLAGVSAVIRAWAPDVVALQEVDVHWGARSGFRDQASELAEALGMEMRFAPIYTLPGVEGAGRVREFGVALLSRHPIRSFTNHPLTRLSTQEPHPVPRPQPGLLEATVEVRGAPVRVFNTHLDYRADPAVRRQQVAEMTALIGGSPRLTLVFGDLNAEPSAPEILPLLERLSDAWTSAEGGLTFPSDEPVKRIDYVLVSRDLQVRRAHVPSATASDHRPVVVEIAFPSGRR